jgi:plasmid stability protein
MPTLYVAHIPKELYDALRARARGHRASMAAEVLALLEQSIPMARELKAWREFLRRTQRLRALRPRALSLQ